MNFLLDYGVKEETINKIKETTDESIIFYFLTKEKNVIEVIKYLSSIQIKVIDRLLVNRLELFMLPVEKIKKQFENYNIEVLVQLINEDINVLNNIGE